MNKTRWLAIVGRKGGSGKTALALGLAAHYARAGRRVLLVDLDPQGSASLTLGDGAEGGHLAEVLAGTAAPEMVTYDTFSNCPPLALLSGGPALENVNAARPLRDVLAGVDVDLVLLDCPPGHADLDRLALCAADAVLACTEAHRLGIAGAARVLAEARALRPCPACALVLGRVDAHRGLDRAAPDLLAGAFGVPVLAVRQDSALALALNAGSLPPASGRAAADLEAVAAWIDKQTERKGTP
jgi:chromosome partitioning protein